MASEGGIPSYKNQSSGAASDDEISVIAVIKKGTSGIPKRARYHYIRELPLTSVKSFKKSLQKAKEIRRSQGRVSISAIERCPKSSASTEGTLRVVNNVKKPRVIELSDEVSKMELRKQFKIVENDTEETGQSSHPGLSSVSTSGDNNIVHKLPPGTVLIKQEPRTPKLGLRDDKSNLSNPPEMNNPGSNTNGSSAGATTATTSTSSSNTSSSGSSSASSISSCGSGSSSGGFGSGSASPLTKVNRLHRGSKGSGSRKKIVEVVPRRNPKRSGSKKGAGSMVEVAIPTSATTTMTTRPRQRRLLAIRRQERNEISAPEAGGINRRTKLATMPYMNTRSVTRKLYTVGATYQAPTRKDETEWREWPVHGMHERPVFHPQIGLAASYAGRVFWSTPDAEGLNWTYREVLDAPEDVEIVPVDPRPDQIQSTPSPIKTSPEPSEETFEVCMHESLHSVLAYCAQVMAPGYRNMVEKKRRHDLDARSQSSGEFLQEKKVESEFSDVKQLDAESTNLNLSQLEDSSISDETLMEMSSIYKKLLPIEDQPSSQEGSPSASTKASPSSGNNCGGEKTSKMPKYSSEASEIAKILSEYNESLKETNFNRSAISVTNPQRNFGRDSEETEVQQKILATGKTIAVNEGAKMASKTDINGDHWLEELLMDTSLLYCVATGACQRDLTKYVDSLDAKQSLQWLRRRDG